MSSTTKPSKTLPKALLCTTLCATALTTLPGTTASADDLHVNVTTVEVKGSDTPKVVAKATIPLPPEKIWKVVSDCAHYKERMPHIAASTLLKQDGNRFTCKVTIAMPFPLSNLTAETEAVHTESAEGMSRRWKLIRGDYKVNEGSWEIKPADGGQKSIVTYSVHAEPNNSVPAWLREAAQKKAIPEMFERVKSEAAKM